MHYSGAEKPKSPVAGDIWFDTVFCCYREYIGNFWLEITAAEAMTKIVAGQIFSANKIIGVDLAAPGSDETVYRKVSVEKDEEA
jgi:hypothetical protein